MTPERVDGKKLYVFDLGGVLLDNVDFRPRWCSALGVDRDEFYRTYNEYIWPIMDGSMTVEAFYAHLEKYFSLKIEGNPFLDLFFPRLNEDVRDTVLRLKEEGNRVVTGTNNCVPHWAYIRARGWDSFFHASYPSQEIGLSKPYASFFRYILRHEGFDPSSAVMIDDSAENIRGAEKVGMKTLHLTPERSRKELYSDLKALWR